jgi:hypothetical protein
MVGFLKMTKSTMPNKKVVLKYKKQFTNSTFECKIKTKTRLLTPLPKP